MSTVVLPVFISGCCSLLPLSLSYWAMFALMRANQHSRREKFLDVVVGPRTEAADLVDIFALRSDHEDRGVYLFTEFAAGCEPRPSGAA